jgi:cytochrome c peroxidase
MSKKDLLYLFGFLGIFGFLSCQPEDTVDPDPTTTPYELDLGNNDLPPPPLPADNPLTQEGVSLGRHLFYEVKLSGNNTMSCGSCHFQEFAFTDTAQLSLGIQGLPGKRNSMAAFNLAYHQEGFFWDGRATALRDQVLLPIEDELELDATVEDVIAKLEADPIYPPLFEAAFGDATITPERIALAMEQFGFSIISKDSKYDRFLRGEVALTPQEEHGRMLFFAEHRPDDPPNSGADCFHCHGGSLFTNNQFMNNGLDADFVEGEDDMGLYEATGKLTDIGKFKVPSLRNIALTAPYMHDGRFATLEEVIQHYNSGAVDSPNLDPNMHAIVDDGLDLDTEEVAALIAFLNTLTDPVLLSKEAYSNPFE